MANPKNQTEEQEIRVADTSIAELFEGQKFIIDFFQREYNWRKKHLEELIHDFVEEFRDSYKEGHEKEAVEEYKTYYLGPMVFSTDDDPKSIIDGQQRFITLTLFLIYLCRLQKELKVESHLEPLLGLGYRKVPFNLSEGDKERKKCFQALYKDGINGAEAFNNSNDSSVTNMINRYREIDGIFIEVLGKYGLNRDEALTNFTDWVVKKVIVIKIEVPFENTYKVFETMNDRGLEITNAEKLKGYVLSNITNDDQRNEINDVWREKMSKLREEIEFKKDEKPEEKFFQVWFRAQYANSIRTDKEDKDWELIGTQFHRWFKDNHKDKELFNIHSSEDFYTFFRDVFPFFADLYIDIRGIKNKGKYNKQAPHLCYVTHPGMTGWWRAESLQDPLLLAPIRVKDEKKVIYKKLDVAAKYIETLTVRRVLNRKSASQSGLLHNMFNTIKSIRHKETTEVFNDLREKVKGIEQTWSATETFNLNNQNKKFTKHLLSRISSHVDYLAGDTKNYLSYQDPGEGKPYEIEHIWADNFEAIKEHVKDNIKDEFQFEQWRNKIGALLLLPQGVNQSLSDKSYEKN